MNEGICYIRRTEYGKTFPVFHPPPHSLLAPNPLTPHRFLSPPASALLQIEKETTAFLRNKTSIRTLMQKVLCESRRLGKKSFYRQCTPEEKTIIKDSPIVEKSRFRFLERGMFIYTIHEVYVHHHSQGKKGRQQSISSEFHPNLLSTSFP
jgi:hypothetical protein